MSLLENFNDLNVKGTLATEVMNILGMYPEELNDPLVFNRFQDIIEHLSQYSSAERNKIIRNVGKGEQDKMMALWQYCELNNEISELEDEVDEIDSNISAMEEIGGDRGFLIKDNSNKLSLKGELKDRIKELKSNLDYLY